jgi:CO/xanthine dehydrogenase FAD-binding subunit
MKSHPADYELVAPNNLPSVLSLLAQEPGTWLPIAGGTDLMVQCAAGHLAARKLVSIWNLAELRRIEILPGEIRVGAGCTYTDLIENDVVNREFPLLTSAARWTGDRRYSHVCGKRRADSVSFDGNRKSSSRQENRSGAYSAGKENSGSRNSAH